MESRLVVHDRARGRRSRGDDLPQLRKRQRVQSKLPLLSSLGFPHMLQNANPRFVHPPSHVAICLHLFRFPQGNCCHTLSRILICFPDHLPCHIGLFIAVILPLLRFQKMAHIIDDKSEHCIPFLLERIKASHAAHQAAGTIPPPFFLGLNGVQGAGKTTLVGTRCRFYTP